MYFNEAIAPASHAAERGRAGTLAKSELWRGASRVPGHSVDSGPGAAGRSGPQQGAGKEPAGPVGACRRTGAMRRADIEFVTGTTGMPV